LVFCSEHANHISHFPIPTSTPPLFPIPPSIPPMSNQLGISSTQIPSLVEGVRLLYFK
jgi:hypothetical protein